MPGAERDALILSFRAEVLADALVRVLNDSMTLDQRSDRFLPRRLDLPNPRSLLWWDHPVLTLDQDGHVVLALALAGGIRQADLPAAPARIASVQGTLRARYEPALGATAGAPHLMLALEALDLTGLRVHYAGSHPLPLLDLSTGRDAAVASVVKDAAAMLAAQPLLSDFMGSLGRRPLSYVPAAFSIPAAASTATLRVYGSQTGGALVMTLAQPSARPDTPAENTSPVWPDESNAAVTFSGAYLSSRLAHLLATGQVQRTLWDSTGAELARLDTLSLALDDDRLTLRGRVARGGVGASLLVSLRIALSATTGQAQVVTNQMVVDLDTVRASSSAILGGMDAQDALYTLPRRLSRTFWPELVAALLGGRVEDEFVNLSQRFVVPGTSITLDAPVRAVDIGRDSLTLYTAIRLGAHFVADPPRRAPRVAVAQRDIPTQAAQHAPVAAVVEAQIVAPSYPPYDFAWETDTPQPPHDAHAPALSVNGTPFGAGDDPEGIARVSVSLIDAFGQVAHSDARVLAHPVPRQRQQRPVNHRLRALLRVLLPAVLAVILVIASAAVVLSRFGLGTSVALSTPTVNVLPATTYNQTCAPAVQALSPIPVTLDNSAGGVAVAWRAVVPGALPGSAEPWASLSSVSGTIPARGVAAVTITPAADLCASMRGATTQQAFFVTFTYFATANSLRGASGFGVANVSGAPAIAASSRQAVITDTVNYVNVSAYVAAGDNNNTTDITGVCDASFVLRPDAFTVVLDNTQSTAATSWQVSVPDLAAPPATPGPTAGTPVPTSTSASPEPWARASSTSGTLPAGQRERVGVVTAKDLCARIGPATSPVTFHLIVTFDGDIQVTITDTVSPYIIQ